MKNRSIILISIILFLIISCEKQDTTCIEYNSSDFGFNSYELIQDTLLQTDTAFTSSDVYFRANNLYSNLNWTIGKDTRIFTSQTVHLRFESPEEIKVSLNADAIDKACNAINQSYSKNIVVVQRNISKPSPLVGDYLGYNTDKKDEMFRVKIKFWSGSRYSWWPDGAYSLENLPRSFIDTNQNWNGIRRPEITGHISSTGYKNLVVNRDGYLPACGIQAYASLKRGSNDTLLINYKLIDTARIRLDGQIIYLNKTFIGIKN